MSHKIVYERWTFPADKIREGNIYLATSLLASSLEVNSLYAVVECEDKAILNFRRNTKLQYYADPDRPMIFRVQKIERIAPKLYKISATSTLGLLTEGQHYGGMYNGETVLTILRDICGSVPFVVKGNLANIKRYGWLPIASPRDNLAQLLFSIGATLKTDLDGVLRIESLWDGIGWYADADNVSNEGTAPMTAPVTSVVVTEHQYIKGSESKVLFEGTTQKGDVITFSEPMHTLSAVGFYIEASGANWARLSAGTGTLTGQTYIHNTREVTQTVTETVGSNIKRVTDATLVSMFDVRAVANRLARFYRMRESIDAPVIYQGEQPGSCISICHPFDRAQAQACLQSADITLSNTLVAQEKLLVGFKPERVEMSETYNSRELLTGDGEWQCPNGVYFVEGVLIGGGDGGWSGLAGKAPPDYNGKGPGGDGGDPGPGGFGGKVARFSLAVEPGKKYRYHSGKGGYGGKYLSGKMVPGSDGEPSTFEHFSSSNGASLPYGFTESMTMETYAIPGKTGQAGGKGGVQSESRNGEDVIDFDIGIVYRGGRYLGVHYDSSYYYKGGCGGGAAMGEAGSDGGLGGNRYVPDGGRGANATKPKKADKPGQGGNGGNGGGGGGANGTMGWATSNPESDPTANHAGKAGLGGDGSDGGDGGDGIIILYYAKPNQVQARFGHVLDRNGRRMLDRLNRRFIV